MTTHKTDVEGANKTASEEIADKAKERSKQTYSRDA
jgi:hypothetical protein